MNTELNLDAEIIPNQSLGGLSLRTKLKDIQNIANPRHPTKTAYHLSSPFEAVYRPGNGEIAIAVDVRNGKVFRITASQGYRGTVFGAITIGMKVSEATTLEPLLSYDEAEELIRCKGVDGLSIDIPEIDPALELVPDMVISAISVYASEAMTLQGQCGDW